jgi:crossover junction endodeoxyribonuclease RuvC
MLILGLDPGSLKTGFGLIDKQGSTLKLVDAGCLTCGKDWELPRRLAHICRELRGLLDTCSPVLAALESPFHGMNSRSLIVLAQARGALLATLGLAGIEIREYSPAEVKSSVTGNGRADKDQVSRMVQLLLGLQTGVQTPAPGKPKTAPKGWGPDVTDALAVALCCAQRFRLEQLGRKG